MRNALRFLNTLASLPFRGFVRLYQRTLSPDHGPLHILFPFGYCRHHPTCSEYALEQLKSHLLPVALAKITIRIASCHPWKKISDEKIIDVTRH